MTYDAMLQWFVPLTVCVIGLACLWQAEKLWRDALEERRRCDAMVKLFIEGVGLMRMGAVEEGRECLEKLVQMGSRK